MIRIYEPYKIEPQSVVKVLSENKLTYLNSEIGDVARIISTHHNGLVAHPVFNGTCATHMLFKALQYKVKNLKYIIVPNNVYVAAWNSMLMDGNDIKLIPVDADLQTWCVNVQMLSNAIKNSNPDETGVLIVHNVGSVVNVPLLKRNHPNFQFIEDNCEGFLGSYEGFPTGTKSLASSISFYANKILTCGEGGAFISSDSDVADLIYRYTNQGQTSERYVHDLLAYNYRMTNIQAALLLSQFSLLNEILEKKTKIFEFYENNLSRKYLRQISMQNTKHSKWMFAIRLENSHYKEDIDTQCQHLFETRPMFFPMSSHTHMSKYSNPDDEIVAKLLSKECFMLPSHPNLNEKNLDTIVRTLNKIVE